MAKQDSQHLYQLIHTLTPHEKAYFVRFVKQHTSGNTEYLKLYHALLKMREYKPAELQKKFRNLPILKNYLFNQILNALAGYYNNPAHPQVYLFSRYIHAYILEKKGFTKMAATELQHGINTAAPGGHTIFQYLLGLFQHRQQSLLTPPAKRGTYFNNKYTELNMLLERERQSLRYIFEFDKVKLYHAVKHQGLTFDVSLADIDLNLLHNPAFETGVRDNRLRFETLLLYYQCEYNHADAYRVAHQYLKYEKDTAGQPGNNQEFYSRALLYAAISSSNFKKPKEAVKHLEALKAIKTENAQVKRLNEARYVTARMNLFCETKEYSKGSEFVHSSMKTYPYMFDVGKADFQHFYMLSYALFLLFYNKDFDTCIYFLNRTNMVNARNNAPDLYKDMEMLRLMLQLEMGNYSLLGTLTNSLQDKLKKQGGLDDAIKILLRYFKLYAKGHIKPAEKKATVTALQKLQKTLPEGSFQYLFMKVVPYVDYIKSK